MKKKLTDLVVQGEATLGRDVPASFNEAAFISETLDLLVEMHGSYTLNDERLVKMMAGYQRSFDMADIRLMEVDAHIRRSGLHGEVASAWFDMRDRATTKILSIRKDLRIDVSSRNPIVAGRTGNKPLFNSKIKEEKELVRR